MSNQVTTDFSASFARIEELKAQESVISQEIFNITERIVVQAVFEKFGEMAVELGYCPDGGSFEVSAYDLDMDLHDGFDFFVYNELGKLTGSFMSSSTNSEQVTKEYYEKDAVRALARFREVLEEIRKGNPL
jgi:hypothetical protein